jgi:lipopolysaccharide transport system ATP-binding protein
MANRLRNVWGATRRAFGRYSTVNGQEIEEFWALHDVSFQVKQGEVVGIIGRNGAGKSTLLKILSRITEPTTGRVTLRGRVASLLEVGTGFHPELTGRENIFLNGAILGMTRAEVKRKFDEIVSFAEVDQFLDTPVKRYSSGMYVRLAFAVAAHLEPEILLVDEVLAVGDAEFQRKCLGKMQDVSHSGRTVFFVSHNMSAVQHLCKRAMLLRDGRIHEDGASSAVIANYLSDAMAGRIVALSEWKDRESTGDGRVVALEVTDDQSSSGSVRIGGELLIRVQTIFHKPMLDPIFGVVIHDVGGQPLLDIRSSHDNLRIGRVEGAITVEMRVPRIGLYPGRYFLSPWIADSALTSVIDFPHLCGVLNVLPSPSNNGDIKLDPAWGKYHVSSLWTRINSV